MNINKLCLVWVIADNTWRKGEFLGQSNLPNFYDVKVTDCHSSAKGLTLQVTRNLLRNRPAKQAPRHHTMTPAIQAKYDAQAAERELRNLLRVHKDTFMSKRSTELL